MRPAESIKLTPVAQIAKTYNSTGEVLMRISSPDFEERFPVKEPVFIYFEGLPVPFFIDAANLRAGNAWIVKFTTIRDGAHAQELVGLTVYTEDASEEGAAQINGNISAEAKCGSSPLPLGTYLNGWTILDESGSVRGTVCGFYDIPGNPCLEVAPAVQAEASSKPSDTQLIPIHQDLIVKVEAAKKTITLKIPDGLLH